jgi:hypothetical protein
MNMNLKRTLATITFLFATISVATHVPAQQAVPALLNVHSSARLGLTYTVRNLGFAPNGVIKVQQTTPGLGCAVAGLEPGDQIWYINNQRVKNKAELQNAVANSPNPVRIKIKDYRTGQFAFRDVQLTQFAPPAPPAPPAPAPPGPGAPSMLGMWRSSLGGTMTFTPAAGGYSGRSVVPFVGSSWMTCTETVNGTYTFTYQNDVGVVDSGHGTLRFVGQNIIKGKVHSQSGIRADFTLTR